MWFGENLYPLAMVRLFSEPDEALLVESSGTVYLCEPTHSAEGLVVIPVSSIKMVVSMLPETQVTQDGKIILTTKFSLLQHPFVDLAECGLLADIEEEELQLQFGMEEDTEE